MILACGNSSAIYSPCVSLLAPAVGSPSTTVEVLTTLDKSGRVIVTGKVEGRDWFRVALAGGEVGFAFGKLLGGDAPEELQTTTVVPVRGVRVCRASRPLHLN
jgi:hypothetical protein